MYSNNVFVLLRGNELLLQALLDQVQAELRRVELTSSEWPLAQEVELHGRGS